VAVLPAVAFTVRSRHRQIERTVFHRPDNAVTVRVRQQVAVAVVAVCRYPCGEWLSGNRWHGTSV
ncbi:hypothetical protein ODY10_22550, partial [Escherichia coli]|nr:hypothetical protein [Escherichia coli]